MVCSPVKKKKKKMHIPIEYSIPGRIYIKEDS